ncbi:unnamed protein product, partial [Symbiodinium natans]
SGEFLFSDKGNEDVLLRMNELFWYPLQGSYSAKECQDPPSWYSHYNPKLNYEAESPDEFALVKAAASQGWEFKGRRGQDLTVSYYSPSQPRQDLQYRVLATNAFNSARKRMSVVVQRGPASSNRQRVSPVLYALRCPR